MKKITKKRKFTKSETLIYSTLKESGKLTKKQLVDKLGVSENTVLTATKKFKKYGIVIVYPNMDDLRTYFICLTDKEMKRS